MPASPPSAAEVRQRMRACAIKLCTVLEFHDLRAELLQDEAMERYEYFLEELQRRHEQLYGCRVQY
jgi:hypothetical protein